MSTADGPRVVAFGGGHGLSALRLSLGRWTTADDVDRAVEAIAAACRSVSRNRGRPMDYAPPAERTPRCSARLGRPCGMMIRLAG